MAKIGKHTGPSNVDTGEGLPRRKPAPTAAEMLRQRGKLGPYPQPKVEDTQEHLEFEARAAVEGVEPKDGVTPPEVPETEPTETTTQPTGAEAEEGTEEVVLEQPPRNASREAWAEYVEALTGEEVPEDTTRSELIELYGTPPS